MVRYNLFGCEIVFDDAAMRYYKIFRARTDANNKATQDFDQWYKKAGTIENVLSNYEDIVEKIIYNYGIAPYFSKLASHNIYDISKDSYNRRCNSYTNSYHAIEHIAAKYEKIIEAQGEAEAYRAARKASRGRWQGGGFGLKGAFKGAIEAGALNAVTGIGHSAVNAAGNASSAAAASSEKKKLYKDGATKSILLKGIIADVQYAIDAYVAILNEHYSKYVYANFSYDKASALFTNAKQIPEKRKELLLQAFSFCPWYSDLIHYIFEHYPSERRVICQAAKQFQVNIASAVNAVIAKEYSSEAQSSEELALQARKRILALMEEYSVSDNDTLNQLEHDCLQRLCDGYEIADEETCNAMKASVEAYEALEKNKAPFLQQIQKRIEAIWSSEDDEIFNDLYLKTDLTNPETLQQAREYIQSKSRTSSSEKYIAAIDACNPQNFKKAYVYRKGTFPSVCIALAIALCVFALFYCFVLKGSLLVAGLCFILGIVFACIESSYAKTWRTLTVNETIFHPQITKDLPKPKIGRISSLLAVVLTIALCGGSIAVVNVSQINVPLLDTTKSAFGEDGTIIPDWCNGIYYSGEAELAFHSSTQIEFDISIYRFVDIQNCIGDWQDNEVSFTGEVDVNGSIVTGLLTYDNSGEITLYVSTSDWEYIPEGTIMTFYDTDPVIEDQNDPVIEDQNSEIIVPDHMQEIIVTTYGSTATLTLQEWTSSEWIEILAVDAYIGNNGITDSKVEGDQCTPAGTFDILFAFGTENIQTELPYIQIGAGDIWVDDTNSYYYNTLQNDSNPNKDWSSSEDLYKKFSANRSVACIYFGFNGDGTTGGGADAYGGSDLFIDGVGAEGSLTSGYGDIKISASDMITLLQILDIEKNPCITIF